MRLPTAAKGEDIFLVRDGVLVLPLRETFFAAVLCDTERQSLGGTMGKAWLRRAVVHAALFMSVRTQ